MTANWNSQDSVDTVPTPPKLCFKSLRNSPGKPWQNGNSESFNGKFRDECLNLHWFESLEDAREKFEAWRIDYNDSRPHQALKELTPTEYALKSRSIEVEKGPQQAGG